MFLNNNYEPIANKLSHQQYESLEHFCNELKEFEEFYLNDGPKGPLYREIGLEFLNKSITEGADYFNRLIDNELSLQL